jgi:[FeFe] hydrogenase H-cluster maturation GTPase HydF
MKKTSKGLRLHFGLFGRRNVGKSSLINMITQQNTAIVSSNHGTTTDPIEKPMEFPPIGPVVFIDTAGIDDVGSLGQLRINKTKKVIDRIDIAILVTEAEQWTSFERRLFQEFIDRHIPTLIVFNKSDLHTIPNSTLVYLKQSRTIHKNIHWVKTVAHKQQGLEDFRTALSTIIPPHYIDQTIIVRDLIRPKDIIMLIVPIDKEAPKGRLILPEVQTIRDILDGYGICIISKDTEIHQTLGALKKPPALIITDSSCFSTAAKAIPSHIPLTSFSILFARLKGNLTQQAIDTTAIDHLNDNDAILIAESCTHHPIEEDIARVKIPRLLKQYTKKGLDIHITRGHDFSIDEKPFKLIIHCGACTLTRREVLNRLCYCKEKNIPITNYGLTIAYTLNIFERVLSPFPDIYQQLKKNQY